MARNLKILMWTGIGTVAVLALCVLLLATFDWNRAKPWLGARVTEATGRPFAINGDLSLTWRHAQSDQSGWRGLVPWPRFSAREVSFGNPGWATASANMAEVEHVVFSLNPLALLHKKIEIPTLILDAPDLTLQRAADGKNNWTLKSDQPSEWQFELGRLALNAGRLRVVDAIRKADIKIEIDDLRGAENTKGYQIGWQVSGSFDGARVRGGGKSGALLALHEQEQPYPIDAELKIGKTEIALQGTLSKPRSLAAVDLRLKVSGASMAHLYPIIGLLLPETPAFATEGHLVGTINQRGGDWTYQKFTGKVGSSDLAGSLKYEAREPRPYLSGAIESKLLRLADLAPLIGAGSKADSKADSRTGKAKRGAAARKPADKALPVQTFRTERWTSLDADVKFSGRKIIRDESLPIDDLKADLSLKKGVLSFTPLNFGVAGGDLKSDIKLDGTGKSIKADMKISARRLKLKQLFPAFEPMQASLGQVDGDAALSGTGNSIAGLLGSSNGEMKVVIDQGRISKLLLEQVGLNVGSVILTQLFGDRPVQLNCLVGDFTVTNGLMKTRTFVIDTEEAILVITGEIDLAKEQLNLVINPESKGVRLVSLRAPIYVTGNFKKPEINVDKGVIAAKAGAAIALGILAPIATALLPLINPGERQESGCNQLLEQARKKPAAPAAGTSTPARPNKRQDKKSG